MIFWNSELCDSSLTQKNRYFQVFLELSVPPHYFWINPVVLDFLYGTERILTLLPKKFAQKFQKCFGCRLIIKISIFHIFILTYTVWKFWLWQKLNNKEFCYSNFFSQVQQQLWWRKIWFEKISTLRLYFSTNPTSKNPLKNPTSYLVEAGI